MPVGPLVFVLGAAGVAALLAATGKTKTAPPPLPGTPPGQREVTLWTPGVWDKVPPEQASQAMTLLQALGVDPTTGALVPGKASPDAIRIAHSLAGTLRSMGHTDAATVVEKYATEAERGTPIILRDDVVTTRTPGVWQGVSPAEQAKIAAILIALGVDPNTGKVKTGVATPLSVQTATAMVGVLQHEGLMTAAAQLDAYAKEAAKTLPTPTVAAYDSLPPELATQLARMSEYMNDPAQLRAFIGRLQPYSGIPAVAAAIAMLEAKATQLEAMLDQRDVLTTIDREQAGTGEPVAKPPTSVLPPELQRLLDGALNGLGVKAGVVTAATAYAVTYARQVADQLEKSGYPTFATELRRYADMGAVKLGVPTSVPSAGTYTVKKDDNPSLIAKAYTGDPGRWRELIKANPQKPVDPKTGNFKYLNAGDVLNLPVSWSPPPVVTIPADGKPLPPMLPGTPPPAASTPTTYTVKSGDNPSDIAKRLTGDPNRWRELIKANPQKSVDPKTGNFKYLNAGDVLTLPASWLAMVSGHYPHVRGFASIVGLAS